MSIPFSFDKKIIGCLLCGGPIDDSLTSIDDSALCMAGFKYSRCAACDYYFINPQPKLDSLKSFYNSHAVLSDQAGFGSVLAAHRADNGQRQKSVSDALPSTGGALLDFGCNIGLLLEQNRHRFSEIYGVEINDEAAKFADKELGIRTIFKSLDSIPAVKFSLITMIDVIEHVPDPVAMVKSLAARLTPAGVLFLRLPVTSGVLFSRRAPERWKFVYAPYHLSMFSVKALPVVSRSMRHEMRDHDG